jgi:hypothetical protein
VNNNHDVCKGPACHSANPQEKEPPTSPLQVTKLL